MLFGYAWSMARQPRQAVSHKETEPYSPLCLSGEEMAEWDRKLSLLCGNAPRRVSNEMAVASVMPIAMLYYFVINSPNLDDGDTEVDGSSIWHYHEDEDTLLEGAEFVTGNTWVSNRERSLIDCVQYARSYQAVKLVLRSLSAVDIDPDVMLDLTESIGAYAPLRRVCSIASLLPDGIQKDSQFEIESYAEKMASENVYLCGSSEPESGKVFWADERFGVLWDVPPKSVYNDVYHY